MIRPQIEPAARVNGPTVPGTSLWRMFRLPRATDEIEPGDIIDYDGRQWTVLGWDTVQPLEPDGHQPVRLHLARLGEPAVLADRRRCRLVGRQVLRKAR